MSARLGGVGYTVGNALRELMPDRERLDPWVRDGVPHLVDFSYRLRSYA